MSVQRIVTPKSRFIDELFDDGTSPDRLPTRLADLTSRRTMMNEVPEQSLLQDASPPAEFDPMTTACEADGATELVVIFYEPTIFAHRSGRGGWWRGDAARLTV